MKHIGKAMSSGMLAIVLVLVCHSMVGYCEGNIESQYMKHDFSSVLNECEKQPLAMLPSNGGLIPSDVLVDDLSPAEVDFLSTYQYSETVIIGIGYTVDFAITYAKQHQAKIPGSGVDIMLRKDENYSQEMYDKFEQLSPKDKLLEACRAINPGTGRFAESFSKPDWHKFGVFIEPVEGDEAIEYFPEMIPASVAAGENNKAGLAPHQTWHLVVFGEKPGRILVDKFVWRRMGDPIEESAGPCGGCGKKKKGE